jgi:hypothetical protein
MDGCLLRLLNGRGVLALLQWSVKELAMNVMKIIHARYHELNDRTV